MLGRRAYTLVEVLAVTVLLGLIASLGVPSLLRSIGGDPLGRSSNRLIQAFRDARAQGHGHRISLKLSAVGFDVVLADTAEGADRAPLPTLRLSDAIELTWTRNGRPLQHLDLDERGHGLDAEVVVRADSREARFGIDGLTGVWSPLAAP